MKAFKAHTLRVLGHLGPQGTRDQAFGQLLKKAVLANEVFRLFVANEQLVDQFVAYGHGSSFWMFGSFLPFDRLHKVWDTLQPELCELEDAQSGGR